MIAWLALWMGLAVAAPLTLPEVLDAVERTPQLDAAASRVDEARGAHLATRGAFDPRLSGSAWTYTGGTDYARYAADVGLEVPTTLGPSVGIGWRVGQGTFPAYDGYWETVQLGRARVSVSVPLLEGLGIGAERARMLLAERRVEQVEVEVDVRLLQLQRRAAEAWWRWVGAGARLEVEQGLLELAVQRQAALDRQVALGNLAEIDALDHERVVQGRRSAVVDAEQQVEVAARMLSLWYRDGQGEPVVPARERLPELPTALAALPEGDDVQRALASRPELVVMDVLLDAAQIERRRAANLRLPRLDVVGRLEEPMLQSGPPEVYAGVKLEAPLLQRRGRGEHARATAMVARLQSERQALADQVRAEVEAARLRREAAEQQAEALQIAAERAERVAQLEQRAFSLGSSDLFRVLVREQTLAEASREAIAARVAVGLEDAAWRAAVGWTEPFGE